MDGQEPRPAQRTCPSAPCEPGAVLLGVFDADGKLGYVTPQARVNAQFAARVAAADAPPEQRFRFAGACVEHRCAQWTGRSCGVIEKVLVAAPPQQADAALPACSIRSTCRWFAQAGRDACAVCPLVTTDSG